MNKLVCVFIATSALFFSSFGAQSDEFDIADNVDSLRFKAGNGEPQAQYELGRIHANSDKLDRDMGQAFSLIEKSAEQGFLKAQSWLCVYYANPGEYKDRARSLYWCKVAAKQGDSSAQSMIAVSYLTGDDELNIAMDEPKAFALYSASALGGDTGSQNMVAYMLAKGIGTERDLVTSYAWYLTEFYLSAYSNASSRESVAKRLTAKQVSEAEMLSTAYIDEISKKQLQPVEWL